MAAKLIAAALALLALPAHAAPRTILFIGNSFTFGDKSSVRGFHPDRVTDLNGEGIGGVPALFATFARQAGQDWQVSLETSPGKPLSWHLANKGRQITGRWDVVSLQGYSTFDPARPGDPTAHVAAARALVRGFRAANPKVRVALVSTWPRADLVYRSESPWRGKTLAAMADDLARGNALARGGADGVDDVIPVGQAWMRAINGKVADPDPYDGTAPGQIDLWTWDHYHGSAAGYYLEALVIFGRVTGVDVRTLGDKEKAAYELGLSPAQAVALQETAAATLAEAR